MLWMLLCCQVWCKFRSKICLKSLYIVLSKHCIGQIKYLHCVRFALAVSRVKRSTLLQPSTFLTWQQPPAPAFSIKFQNRMCHVDNKVISYFCNLSNSFKIQFNIIKNYNIYFILITVNHCRNHTRATYLSKISHHKIHKF